MNCRARNMFASIRTREFRLSSMGMLFYGRLDLLPHRAEHTKRVGVLMNAPANGLGMGLRHVSCNRARDRFSVLERAPPKNHMDPRKEDAVATLNWSQCSAVESIPGKVSGAW